MTTLLWIVGSGVPSAVNTFFICRFLCRTLNAKRGFGVTFVAMLIFECIYGSLNSIFHIAGTIPTNSLYYCVGNFASYTLFFRGSLLKRLYFTILIWCSYGIMFHIFLPINYLYVFSPETSTLLSVALMNVVMALLQGALWEYIGRKFQNLRNDLPPDYTIYLTFMAVFVYTAIMVAAEYALRGSGESDVWIRTVYCSLFSALGMVVTVWGVLSVDRHMSLLLSEQIYSLQATHFKSKEQNYRQLTRLKHDIKNHFLCLEGLLREGKAEQASVYLEALTKLAADTDRHIQTGNDFADAILNEKYAEAQSNEVKLTVNVALPSASRIDPVDLGCILSNTLDNAIRAAAQTDEKSIEMRAFPSQSQLVIEIKNDIAKPVNIQNGRVYSNDSSHGVGLESVSSVIEKYGGIMEITSDKRYFTFSAMLPLE